MAAKIAAPPAAGKPGPRLRDPVKMRTMARMRAALYLLILSAATLVRAETRADRVAAVTRLPGLVAFWDFVAREPAGARRFIARQPPGAAHDYALDAGNYVRDFWGTGRAATYDDFSLLGRGPFGQAIRIRREADPDFRPLLLIPRERLHNTPLDRKGTNGAVTAVVWAIRESGNHALAGIWHEGTDLRQRETTNILRAVRGQRQYGLFAGLSHEGTACGHLSENGAGSFRFRYALHKCHSAASAPAVPADAPTNILDRSWQCFAMTFDPARQELTGWLDGHAGDRWQDHPQGAGFFAEVAKAWRQGHLHREPGQQPDEDPTFPPDQFYLPPEDEPVSMQVISHTGPERVEQREYRFTRVRVTLHNGREVARELVGLRLNPWWFPHPLYAPPDDGSGGPFTIGRVIHSSRGVGFTGWIGGVAVFDRALADGELRALAALDDTPTTVAPEP